MNKLSDAEILNKLKSPIEQDSNDSLRYIYGQYYPIIRSYILNNSGKQTDAKDIFQDSISALYKHVKAEKEDPIRNIKSYLITVSKNLWLKKCRSVQIRRDHQDRVINHTDSSVSNPFEIFVDKEQKNNLKSLVQLLGEECQKILLLFYYEDMKMKNIATHMSLSDEQAAKNKKYKCLKKLKSIVLSNDKTVELLK